MKFCFLCGKKNENLVKGYCEECYKKQFQLIEVPDEIAITVCTKCQRIKEKNIWRSIEIDNIIRDRIKVIGKDVKIRTEVNGNAKIYASGYLEGLKKIKEEVQEVKLKMNKQICSDCSKQFGKYYETLIQVRGTLTNDDFDAIDDIILKRGGFYRIKEVRGGCDFYLSSKNLEKSITDLLRRRYRVQIKKSFTLVTRQEGKDIYRDTVLVRISD